MAKTHNKKHSFKFSIFTSSAPDIGHSRLPASGRLDSYDIQPDELEDYDSEGIAITTDAVLQVKDEKGNVQEIQLTDPRIEKFTSEIRMPKASGDALVYERMDWANQTWEVTSDGDYDDGEGGWKIAKFDPAKISLTVDIIPDTLGGELEIVMAFAYDDDDASLSPEGGDGSSAPSFVEFKDGRWTDHEVE